MREILSGLLELLPRLCEMLSRLVGLLPRLAEVVPCLAELGGGSVIVKSTHADLLSLSIARACLMPTLPDRCPPVKQVLRCLSPNRRQGTALRSFAINKNKRDEETHWAMLITAPATSTRAPSLGSASRVRYRPTRDPCRATTATK